MTSRTRLGRPFFARPSPEVAADLIGCLLVKRTGSLLIRVEITETEAYLGEDDPASHARMGPTPRNQPMYGRPGCAYVYLIYGMHHCLNIVTGRVGEAQAVLLRGALSLEADGPRLDGPGRLCRALEIDLRHNRLDLCGSHASEMWVEVGGSTSARVIDVGPRVGVRDTSPLRFMATGLPDKKGAGPEGPRSKISAGALHRAQRISRAKLDLSVCPAPGPND